MNIRASCQSGDGTRVALCDGPDGGEISITILKGKALLWVMLSPDDARALGGGLLAAADAAAKTGGHDA